ncbi:MAG: hypothetical protein KKG59_03445 [Nanoarchaeota archaeon]|nr:hypothetical protein [Nanoarchaeota archaeon]
MISIDNYGGKSKLGRKVIPLFQRRSRPDLDPVADIHIAEGTIDATVHLLTKFGAFFYEIDDDTQSQGQPTRYLLLDRGQRLGRDVVNTLLENICGRMAPLERDAARQSVGPTAYAYLQARLQEALSGGQRRYANSH